MAIKQWVLVLMVVIACNGCQTSETQYKAIEVAGFSDVIKHWNDQNHRDPQPRYALHQIRLIANNILRYQRANGGWPENINPLRIMSEQEIARQATLYNATDTSFDNRNVYPQIRYLAEVYQQTHDEKYQQAVIRGLRFILSAQLANGGFTHSPPSTERYYGHITIMDDVMAGVLGLLQEITLGSQRFNFLPAKLVQQISEAHSRGDALLLNLQVKTADELTIWAGQYDAVSLLPTQGRAFELASLVSRESVDVVRYLMNDPLPSAKKRQAIHSAMTWFKKNALTGIDMVQVEAEPVRYKYHTSTWDRVMVTTVDSAPIWARFYDLATQQPLLANRQGQRVDSLAQISRERRTGYDWYGRWPAPLLTDEYKAWQQKHAAHGTNTQ
ncbi:MAG: pectate lyase [Pseudomonadota bacterium]|nr:pectate lyase [Pseudomonadota bacterium]